MENGFIGYLNSLHNLNASGANALAESQAMSPYFGELYQPFPLTETLVKALSEGPDKVVILTGHAGDGKSIVALDVLKKLRCLPSNEPLAKPMEERETIVAPSVTIVKDMSELSAERRQQWLREAFNESGSWLIVSNTGPLLQSLMDYSKNEGIGNQIESDILDRLDQSFANQLLEKHTLSHFNKELVILNLTRLDNVGIGAKILTKMVRHSAWEKCTGCTVESACPLMINRQALQSAGEIVEERVRLIYQRLSAYEQRLTLRQIVAQLALGLTGGMTCEEAQQLVASSSAEGADRSSLGLERIIFSEGFFGYRGGITWPEAEGLHAIELVRRKVFGGPVGVNFERLIACESGMGWAQLPASLKWLENHWRKRSAESAGVRWRFALRRMNFIFGDLAEGKEELSSVFLDSFLQSPKLRDFDRWRTSGELTLSRTEKNALRSSCLRVLLEVFSGFGAGQFLSHDNLYLTLRRPDQAVVQPTQLVIDTLKFRDFELDFNPATGVLVLNFRPSDVELPLMLPLLDYICRRDAGELGNALSPIHQAQLDWFRAELLRATEESRHGDEEIELLRSGLDGEVHLHRFQLDKERGTLEIN